MSAHTQITAASVVILAFTSAQHARLVLLRVHASIAISTCHGTVLQAGASSVPHQIKHTPTSEPLAAGDSTSFDSATQIAASGLLPGGALRTAQPGTLPSSTSETPTLPSHMTRTAESLLSSNPATARPDLLSSSTAYTVVANTQHSSAAQTGTPAAPSGSAASSRLSSSKQMTELVAVPSFPFQTAKSDELTTATQITNTAQDVLPGLEPQTQERTRCFTWSRTPDTRAQRTACLHTCYDRTGYRCCRNI